MVNMAKAAGVCLKGLGELVHGGALPEGYRVIEGMLYDAPQRLTDDEAGEEGVDVAIFTQGVKDLVEDLGREV